ncbi:MAG: LacI family DNA-binding transcriptional regulator [Pseudomonadales bacterium]
MATLRDVAEKVGVSVATVSYVLNGTGSVSKEVQDKVRVAVKKLGYRPNRKAQAMRTGFTKSIGLILPDLTNPFFPALAQKVEVEARQKGFTVVLFDTQNQSKAEEEGFQILDQHGVDGIIWCPVSDVPPKSIKAVQRPIVVVDRPLPGFDVVQSDYRRGGALLADYVNRSGHTRVGMLSGPQNIESARQRRLGFIEGISKGVRVLWEVEVPFSIELTSEAKKKLKTSKATLIVCADDVIAIGVINVLDGYDVRVPDDVSVVGFDNIPWSTVIKPQLTTVNQPVGAIGGEAVNLLAQKIQKCSGAVKTIILNVDLVERDSAKSRK